MMTKSILTLALASLCSLALSGCETGDDRALASGQACLDSATTAAQANQCATIVQGLTSSESYLIRCSANFVAQGLTGSRIASAISNVNKTGSGTDATTGLIAFLVFKQASPTADEAITNCTASGSKSMLRLATAAKLATTIANSTGALAGFDPTSPTAAADMQTLVNNMIAGGTAQSKIDLGNTAVIANTAFCGAGSSYTGTQVCTDLQTSIATSSDPTTIANALLNLLKAAH
jgi:hypothetical protein